MKVVRKALMGRDHKNPYTHSTTVLLLYYVIKLVGCYPLEGS